jgi:hypothetical protein
MLQRCPVCGGIDKQAFLLGTHSGPLCERCRGFSFVDVPPPVPGLGVPLAVLATGVGIVVAVAVFSPRLRAAGEFGWLGGLLVGGCLLALVGFRLVFRATIARYGARRVPTSAGLLILLALLAIPLLVALLS